MNQTAFSEGQFPLTLPGLLARNTTRYGERTSLREKDFGIWQEVSWNRYYEHVKYFCLGLITLGLNKGDRLSILGDNCREWIYADLAAQTLGAVAVGVYATSPANQVGYVVGHSDSTMVVVRDQEQTDKILDVRDQLPLLKKIIVIDMKGLRHYQNRDILSFSEVEEMGREKAAESPNSFEELIAATRPEDVALMVYTSGTTGPPKGAMLTHENILHFTRIFNSVSHLSEKEQIVSYLPLCHVAERMVSVFLALDCGYTVNFADSIDTVQECLYEISPTIFLAVPRIWEKMYAAIHINIKDTTWFKRVNYNFWMKVGRHILDRRLAGRNPSWFDRLILLAAHFCLYRSILDKMGFLRVRFAVSGAAPISPEILKFYYVLGLKIAQVYGQTEITGISHFQHGEDLKIGSVGKTLPEVDSRLAEDGEILLKGRTMFAGYYKDPVGTDKAIRDGWLYTGDVGELDEEGYLFITDRKKDIIITSGGKNISPSEIENRLKCSPYINEAIVIGDKRPYLSALIQLEYESVSKWAMENKIAFTTFNNLTQNEEIYELIKMEVVDCNKEFAQVETIKKFVLLDKELDHDDGELTATMKVRRKTVDEKFADMIESMYGR